ncbi:hypothetical protein Hdeb2414_s0001g00026701 [Helianthus debilis subsp. tardiflorus]
MEFERVKTLKINRNGLDTSTGYIPDIGNVWETSPTSTHGVSVPDKYPRRVRPHKWSPRAT